MTSSSFWSRFFFLNAPVYPLFREGMCSLLPQRCRFPRLGSTLSINWIRWPSAHQMSSQVSLTPSLSSCFISGPRCCMPAGPDLLNACSPLGGLDWLFIIALVPCCTRAVNWIPALHVLSPLCPTRGLYLSRQSVTSIPSWAHHFQPACTCLIFRSRSYSSTAAISTCNCLRSSS